jgi:hypothetical protein
VIDDDKPDPERESAIAAAEAWDKVWRDELTAQVRLLFTMNSLALGLAATFVRDVTHGVVMITLTGLMFMVGVISAIACAEFRRRYFRYRVDMANLDVRIHEMDAKYKTKDAQDEEKDKLRVAKKKLDVDASEPLKWARRTYGTSMAAYGVGIVGVAGFMIVKACL